MDLPDAPGPAPRRRGRARNTNLRADPLADSDRTRSRPQRLPEYATARPVCPQQDGHLLQREATPNDRILLRSRAVALAAPRRRSSHPQLSGTGIAPPVRDRRAAPRLLPRRGGTSARRAALRDGD